MLELFTKVALRENFPNHQLHRGDVLTIVEHHPVAGGRMDIAWKCLMRSGRLSPF